MKTAVYSVVSAGVLLTALAAWSVAAPLPPAERPQEKVVCKGHRVLLNDLAFSPDGQTLVSAGGDGTVRLWDVANGKNLAIFKHAPIPNAPLPAYIHAVAFSPDGKTVASSDQACVIKLWDVTKGVNTTTLYPTIGRRLVFSPDGKTLVATRDCIALYDLETKKPRFCLEKASSYLPIVAFNPKGKLLVAGLDYIQGKPSLTFSLWDAESEKKTMTFKGHTAGFCGLAFSPDTKILASTETDQTVRLWDVATGKNTTTIKDLPGWPAGLAFSPDGKVFACGYQYQGRSGPGPRRGAVRLYETATGKVLATLKDDPGPIFPLVFSPDGRLLASGNYDETITLWKLPLRYAPDK